MKKFIILFLLVFTSHCYSQSGWYSQYCGISNHFRSVFFINQQTGWAGGFINAYAKTTNAGNNWTVINWSYSPESILSLYFINELTGWAGGEQKTVNMV